jgi:hypothetical protein
MRPEQCHLTAAHLKPAGAIFLEADRRDAGRMHRSPMLLLACAAGHRTDKSNQSQHAPGWYIPAGSRDGTTRNSTGAQRPIINEKSSADCRISLFGGT